MEKWIDVLGFEKYYQVSDLGNVRSKDRVVNFDDGRIRTFKGVLRKPTLNKKRGYMYITFNISQKRKTMSVHRIVAESFLGIREGLVVDHIDGDRLNNKLDNLQWITSRMNVCKSKTSKGLTGVSWHKLNNKFISNITISGKKIHLGYFDSEVEANKAYLKALSNE
ncbi:HNH homing endonuclease [Cellulophaga phage phi19:1]|uniref:HNH homing endonuclease n=1 Tax=Cellulophaga phage phi19:1 TaxID=1327970 RepID=R9ZYA0_9CAUD|nr:HNH homing endonuclease [Cellulophaga phage phi19:1]AGO47322.1 HNH homing endonuclease [Cellulophaga phage phi19:1]